MDYLAPERLELPGIEANVEGFDPYPPEKAEDTEFNRKYPPDRFGEEASDTARVWKVYRGEATETDKVELDGWNKTLDVLLIFAGLFSAVSTAFIIESYKLLQQDSTDYVAQTLYDALRLFNPNMSMVDVGSLSLRPPGAGFVADATARWVNGLWLVSLVLSLAVAFLCILAKQWLDQYYARVSGPAQTPRAWAIKHALYNQGLRQWSVGGFIALLPVGLHVSLFSFLAGLVLFLWRLERLISGILAGISGLLLFFYSISNILPLVMEDCAWATSLVTNILTPVVNGIRLQAQRLKVIIHIRSVVRNRLRSLGYALWERSGLVAEAAALLLMRWTAYSTLPVNIVQTRDPTARLEGQALSWLIRTAVDQSSATVAIHAIGAYLPFSPVIRSIRELPEVMSDIMSRLDICAEGAAYRSDLELSRYLRTGLCLDEFKCFFVVYYTKQQEYPATFPAHHPSTYDLPLLLRLFQVTYRDRWSSFLDLGGENIISRLTEYAGGVQSPDAPDTGFKFSTALQVLGLLRRTLSPVIVLLLFKDWPTGTDDVAVFQFLRECLKDVDDWQDARDIATHSSCLKCFVIELWCSMYFRPQGLLPHHMTLITRQLAVMLETHFCVPLDPPSANLELGYQSQFFASFVIAGPFFSTDGSNVELIPRAAQILGCMFRNTAEPLIWCPAQARALCHLISYLPLNLISQPTLAFDIEQSPAFDSACAIASALRYNIDFSADMISHPVYRSNIHVVSSPITQPTWGYHDEHWSNPFCFLRTVTPAGGTPPLRELLSTFCTLPRTFYNTAPFFTLLDVLAAQLCEGRRRQGHIYHEVLVQELVRPEYGACMLSVDSSDLPARERFGYDNLVLRYAQHCTELSEQLEEYSVSSWWSRIEVAALERNAGCASYLEQARRRLMRRGKCIECTSPPRHVPLLTVHAA